ncbi:copper-binding protein [Rhodoferax sp.]|uniref:copper-binding protein n=1 Tax=Rhodoferax sp. TaxID=50421 RepID=UPI0026294C8C|nr:copper-binding protein [Rhodoferax sp.]MDD2924929.1 copper-binding protein [Rhodoferax sp.]
MKTVVAPMLMAMTMVFAAPAMAQADHSTHGSSPAAAAPKTSALGEGLVKRVDKTKGTVTLAHGPMNGMPAMTMAYKVKEASWLDTLQAGQKIRFAADPALGGMTVTAFELLK